MVATTALLFALPVNTSEAGLQWGVMAGLYDHLEASSPERIFVAPVAGLGTPRPCVGANCPVDESPFSQPPELIYDSNTGNLSAKISAVVLNVGAPTIRNWDSIYTLAQLAVDSRLFPAAAATPGSTTFVWQTGGGPLETTDFIPEVLESGGHYVWEPMDWSPVEWPLEGTGIWPPAGKPVAAVVNFGPVLPPGLTGADFSRMGIDDSRSNYVDYFNHRGIVTLHVPLSLEIVPEPRNVIQVILAIIMVWCSRLRPCRWRHTCARA
jgi:hypothetical protein